MGAPSAWLGHADMYLGGIPRKWKPCPDNHPTVVPEVPINKFRGMAGYVQSTSKVRFGGSPWSQLSPNLNLSVLPLVEWLAEHRREESTWEWGWGRREQRGQTPSHAGGGPGPRGKWEWRTHLSVWLLNKGTLSCRTHSTVRAPASGHPKAGLSLFALKVRLHGLFISLPPVRAVASLLSS